MNIIRLIYKVKTRDLEFYSNSYFDNEDIEKMIIGLLQELPLISKDSINNLIDTLERLKEEV